uniref:Rho GTPase-activating protein 29-like n=1 Tax=Saccoglossus kowalevskii TaxID=10224 RepID=A0ABM0LZI6_SACKO|nr:PREDICTED: rho GTPase-activating protein 29-like [Saccoglossus kowalevskii]
MSAVGRILFSGSGRRRKTSRQELATSGSPAGLGPPVIFNSPPPPSEPFGDDYRCRPVFTSGSTSPDASPVARNFSAKRQISKSTGGNRSSKSNSLSSIGSDYVDSAIMDQEDIIQLTQEVRNFSDALGKLKTIFQVDGERAETPRVAAHERLKELLHILRNVLNKYPALHSTDIHTAAVILISQIKGFTSEYDSEDHTEFYNAIDQLALAFSSSVSEYLMGDLDQSPTPTASISQTRSYDNLSSPSLSSDGGYLALDGKEPVCMSPEEIDNTLLANELGVDLALQRAKAWSKYAKDVMSYVEKRIHIETEFSKSLAKLAHTTIPVLAEESYLPLQSIYCTALQQDIEYARNCEVTYSQIQAHKFLEPLCVRRTEHEKRRKELKQTWIRTKKEMLDCKANLEKARLLYVQKQQDYEKARDMAIKTESDTLGSSSGHAKLEKKKKAEEEAQRKADDAATMYKACVFEANRKQGEMEDTKRDLIVQLRELIYQCDQTMKAVTVGYFQLMNSLSAPAPVQFQALSGPCREYEPGAQFSEFIRHQPVAPNNKPSEAFTFEPYVSHAKESPPGLNHRSSSHSMSSTGSGELSEDWLARSTLNAKPNHSGTEKSRSTSQPIQAWSQQQISDSESGSSSRSQDPSPSASPHDLKRKLDREISNTTMSSGDELGDGEEHHPLHIDTRLLPSHEGKFKNVPQSKAAQTHVFRKLRASSKCRECDSYVYFNGAECEHCGIASHKKCLESLAIQCGGKRLQGKMNVFGVRLKEHLQATGKEVPFIISKCISELQYRSLCVKGLYRVAPVKAKVEKLCQTFENGADLVDLSDTLPHLITSVLKLYFRQLPEPLLTFHLYPEFIAIAKESLTNSKDMGEERIVNLLKGTISKLPEENFKTLAVLVHHLKRVSDNSDSNLMSASNLGIVFGPTLLRQSSEGAATLASLVDTPHQARTVELLIHNWQIFGMPEEDISSRGIEVPTTESTDGRSIHRLRRSNSQEEDPPSAFSRSPKFSLTGSHENNNVAMIAHDSGDDGSLDNSSLGEPTPRLTGDHGDDSGSEDEHPTDSDDDDVVVPVSAKKVPPPRRPKTKNFTSSPELSHTTVSQSRPIQTVKQTALSTACYVPSKTTQSGRPSSQYTTTESQVIPKSRTSYMAAGNNRSRVSTGSSVGSSLDDDLSGSTGSIPGVSTTPPRPLPHQTYSPSQTKREPKFV